MKENKSAMIFIALFLAVCIVLSVGLLFVGPAKAGANEQLHRFPELLDKNGQLNDQYFADISAWVNDHFFMRQELISVNRWLTCTIFGHSGEESVILGRNGWLYYGSTLDDYTGANPASAREIFSIAKNISLMDQYCNQQGMSFAFLIAPNKNSLYPENMPNYGTVAGVRDANRVMQHLREENVKVIDLFDAFQKDDATLYFKTDSHWNAAGAAYAADLINAVYGTDSDFYAGPFEYDKQMYTGDLYEMLYPAFTGSEGNLIYGGQLSFSYLGGATKADAITLNTQSDQPGSILVYRDSFGNLLHPYLAASYGTARFSRSNQYDLTGDYDYVLIEIVERNIRYCIENIPVMPSPVVDIILPTPMGTVTAVENSKSKAPDLHTLWTGILPVVPDDDSAVYVECNGTVYEAFLMKDNGFAVYLPEGLKPDVLGYTVNEEIYSNMIE